MSPDPTFWQFLWAILTETWLGVLPATLFGLVGLTAYLERRGHR